MAVEVWNQGRAAGAALPGAIREEIRAVAHLKPPRSVISDAELAWPASNSCGRARCIPASSRLTFLHFGTGTRQKRALAWAKLVTGEGLSGCSGDEARPGQTAPIGKAWRTTAKKSGQKRLTAQRLRPSSPNGPGTPHLIVVVAKTDATARRKGRVAHVVGEPR